MTTPVERNQLVDDRSANEGRLIVPVILAGGAGTRLWPISSEANPKQFQPLVGPLSTYQQALQRVAVPAIFDDPIVVTGERFRSVALKQAEGIGARPTLLLESVQRDSAAAIAAAAAFAEARRPGAMLMILAADHVVFDQSLFQDAVKKGAQAAATGKIVVFGLAPSEPKTSYGYIRPGERLDDDDIFAVEAFAEKPDRARAMRYIGEGYFWNSGNLLFRADVVINELEAHAPELMAAAAAAVERGSGSSGIWRLDEGSFGAAPKISIDYALLEKASNIAVVRASFRWSDIGSWDSVWEASPKDADGNAVQGGGLVLDCLGCMVHSDGPLVAIVGVQDLVVVASQDAVLVTSRKHAQSVRHLVNKVNDAKLRPAEPEGE